MICTIGCFGSENKFSVSAMFRTLASSLGTIPTKLGYCNQNIRRRCNEVRNEV